MAVFAQSPFSTTGCATAIGEQPVKGLIGPAAMGRPMMADGEGGRGGGEGAGHTGSVGARGLSRHGADGHVNHSLTFVDLSAGRTVMC